MTEGIRAGWVSAEREGNCNFCDRNRASKVLSVSSRTKTARFNICVACWRDLKDQARFGTVPQQMR
jgi:superfamily II helicase